MTTFEKFEPYWPSSNGVTTKNRGITIVVEGNIGVGKSTILRNLEQSELYEVLYEPVESWTNCEGYNILKLSYEEPLRWAFTFEVNVFISYAKSHGKSSTRLIKAMERSIYAARNCFTENSKHRKWLHEAEYKILDDLFQISTDKGNCHVDLFVYLRSDPMTCMTRLQARQRPEEDTVPLDYLTELHNMYEQWFFSLERNVQDGTIPAMVVIDANRTKEEVLKDAQAQIQTFLQTRGMA